MEHEKEHEFVTSCLDSNEFRTTPPSGYVTVGSTTSSTTDSNEQGTHGSNLMRNVKREKTISIGSTSIGSAPLSYDNDRPANMQTMTIADSCTDSERISTRLSDEDEEVLQKQFDDLVEENRLLKQQAQKKDILKRKIIILKQENESLKTTHEHQIREAPIPDSSESNLSPTGSTSTEKEQGVFAKSFLLTSTLGGIYIEPIDGVNGISKVDLINTSAMSPNSCNTNQTIETSPGASFIYKPEKRMTSVETQTGSAEQPVVQSNPKQNVYHYSPRIKVATTEEDEEAHRFVQDFKARRIALKLTQSDIGEELNMRAGARYGQSYISRMESIQLSTAIVLRMKPLLLKLLDEKEDDRRRLKANVDFDEEEYQIDRKRKKRTNFTPEQSILLSKYFTDQPRPSPQEVDDIARKIEIDRNSVKMWFNNKRQAEKFRLQPLPTIGSISSVGSINPYASPYAAMPPSFLMSGLMSNMQNAMNPTTPSLNNLKLEYSLNSKLPSTTLSLENVSSQAPFVFNKDLSQLYESRSGEDQKAKISKDLSQLYQNSLNNAVCSTLKKSPSPARKTPDNVTPFSLGPQPPFMFNKDLSSLYQTRSSLEDSPTSKMSSDLVQLYKDRAVDNNVGYNLPSSPPGHLHQIHTIKSISPPTNNPAFTLSQSLISRTLSQASMSHDNSCSPKFSRTS